MSNNVFVPQDILPLTDGKYCRGKSFRQDLGVFGVNFECPWAD